MQKFKKHTNLHIFLLISILLIMVWSFIGCHDLYTWILEAFPVVVAIILIVGFYKKFRFTDLTVILIWVHSIVLLIGAHYTYAEMPLFNWLRDEFSLSRNYYDRVGHFFQGFVPAIIAREVLLLASPLKKGKWLIFIIISICLAVSSIYEILEWIVAEISVSSAVAFLATQGDAFDTQKDMALCLVGAVTALLTLSRLHEKQLKKNIYYRLKAGFG